MNRVTLYRKILSLTGKTPIEFIRSMRLKRAAQLLEKSGMSVAEIAYEVGFNNPKNFAKFFKEEFKMPPSQFAASKKKKRIKYSLYWRMSCENQSFATFYTIICNIRIPCINRHSNSFTVFNYAKDCCI